MCAEKEWVEVGEVKERGRREEEEGEGERGREEDAHSAGLAFSGHWAPFLAR